jgi:hypothetical protein
MNRVDKASEAATRPPNGFAWKRVLIWSFLIYFGVTLVAFASGLSMAAWHIYGDTLEEAIETSGLIRVVAYWVTGAFLYWRFAAPIRASRFLHVLVLLALVELIKAAVDMLVFGPPLAELVDPGAAGRATLAALVGWGLASLGSNQSFKPTPSARLN